MSKINYVEHKFITNQGYEVEILKELKDGYWECIFNDGNGFKTKLREYTIKTKSLKNPFHPTCHGVGFIGCKKTIKWVWKHWSKIIERCHTTNKGISPAYKKCSICDEWYNYKNFESWALKQLEYTKDMALDKDILIKGNKHYSPETCAFVPQRINSLFTKRDSLRGDYPIGVFKRGDNGKFRTRCYTLYGGINNLGNFTNPTEAFYAYKEAKEKLIKEVADQYKNEISEKVYQALYRYEVEITD